MVEEQPFEAQSLSEKINAVNDIIEQEIRGFLHKDNGDVELVNVVENDDAILVYVEYHGACVSCPSSGGTLMSMQHILQTKLSDKIRVITV